MKQPSPDAKPLAVTQGDPAGVGPGATLKAWLHLRDTPDFAFYVRANADTLASEAARLKLDVPIARINHPSEAMSVYGTALPVIDIPTSSAVTPGIADVQTADAIIGSIRSCVEDVWQGDAAAIVTNPISKALLYSAGFSHPGHTEYLAQLAGELGHTDPPLPIMMLIGGGLRVALVTIHIPLMQVANALSMDAIVETGQIVINALKQDFGCTTPRLGVCGLNPHAGEDGTIGREDVEIIRPAIAKLNANESVAIGPRPGDTIFHEMLAGQYDAVLAMYHDQGLIPVKTLDIWGGVNATLGLPFVRTSPDHGTGYDAAAKGEIRSESLIAAIRQARDMANRRTNA